MESKKQETNVTTLKEVKNKQNNNGASSWDNPDGLFGGPAKNAQKVKKMLNRYICRVMEVVTRSQTQEASMEGKKSSIRLTRKFLRL